MGAAGSTTAWPDCGAGAGVVAAAVDDSGLVAGGVAGLPGVGVAAAFGAATGAVGVVVDAAFGAAAGTVVAGLAAATGATGSGRRTGAKVIEGAVDSTVMSTGGLTGSGAGAGNLGSGSASAARAGWTASAGRDRPTISGAVTTGATASEAAGDAS